MCGLRHEVKGPDVIEDFTLQRKKIEWGPKTTLFSKPSLVKPSFKTFWTWRATVSTSNKSSSPSGAKHKRNLQRRTERRVGRLFLTLKSCWRRKAGTIIWLCLKTCRLSKIRYKHNSNTYQRQCTSERYQSLRPVQTQWQRKQRIHKPSASARFDCNKFQRPVWLLWELS